MKISSMNRPALFAFFIFLLLLLGFRFFFFFQNQKEYHDEEQISFEATLLSQPQIFSSYQGVSANLAGGQKIFITASRYPELNYGQKIRVSGKIKTRTGNSTSSLLIKNKPILTMFFPKIEILKSESGLAMVSFIRQKVILGFEQTLPPIFSSLLLGIVFGIKEAMPKDFTNQLRISGVLHVIAASGMNVTMVGAFLSSIFVFFLRRQIALLFTILGILFYAVFAGLEPSIIRASIMGILVFSSQIIGRQNLAAYGLFLAGFLMLFLLPPLIFDVGFQLSFLATFGLLFIKPLLEQQGKIKKVLQKSVIGEDMATTLVAQVSTLPILLLNFGAYSIWSIVVNTLVLWTVPILMILGGIGAIFGLIFAPLGQIFLYLSLPFLIYFQKIVSFFAGLGGVVTLNNFPWQFVLGYYLMLVSLILFWNKKVEKSRKTQISHLTNIRGRVK